MAGKTRKSRSSGIPDAWAIAAMFLLLLILCVIPGIVLDGRPVSALTLMRADALYQYGGFPSSVTSARQMLALPALAALGLILTAVFWKRPAKYAFSASIAALLLGLISLFSARHLSAAGGFAIGAAQLVCAALLLLCLICAFLRRS